jgi:hypothetical protein
MTFRAFTVLCDAIFTLRVDLPAAVLVLVAVLAILTPDLPRYRIAPANPRCQFSLWMSSSTS